MNTAASGANVFQEMWGAIKDPFALERSSKELSATAQRVMIELKDLEVRANVDIRERLEQVRSILNDAIEGGQATIDIAFRRMTELEGRIKDDAINLIYRVQCVSEIALLDQAQRAFKEMILNVKKANPGLTLVGVEIIALRIEDIKIVDPDKAYWATKKERLKELERTQKDETPAYEILSTYQNLAKSAYLTMRHYGDLGLKGMFLGEIKEMERLSAPWLLVVQPTP